MSALVGPDTLILTQPEVRRLAIRLLVIRNRLIAEGAGAAPVAAAMAGQAGGGKIVCVVSGGNLSRAALRSILDGRIPDPN